MRPIGLRLLGHAAVVASLLMAAHATALAQQSSRSSPLPKFIGTETVKSRLGDFDFKNGYPSPEAATKLLEFRTLYRAVEVFQTHIPALSMYQFRVGLRDDLGIREPWHVAIYEDLLDSRSILLTPNSETVYITTFLDLKRYGPTVVEVPPKMLGTFDDMWMRWIIDVGPTGPDQGEGGRFLILPPDFGGDAPSGYFTARSRTYGVWLVLRGKLEEGKPGPIVQLVKKTMEVYPLDRAVNPPKTTFHNVSGMFVNTVHSDDFQVFIDLNQLIQEEPADAISEIERFQLASIGIVKGKLFNPDAKTRALLEEAAKVGGALARVNSYASQDPARMIYPDRQWQWGFLGGSHNFDADGYLDLDRRAYFSYVATVTTPAMVKKFVGTGSQYLVASRDKDGAYLDGGKNYKFTLPGPIPAKDFWSVVAYDVENRSELQNGRKVPAISTYTSQQMNADGGVDIYFGPDAPRDKESNWIPTVKGKGFFFIVRLYGPLEPFFDQTWKPGDVEELR